MEQHQPSQERPTTDEIDLGQLIKYIRQGLLSLFKIFLRLFVYLRKNIVKLAILAVAGLVVGFGLNQIVDNSLKTEVIVKPNLESKNYLYDMISLINAKVKEKDTSFFKDIGFNPENIKGFSTNIIPVENNASEIADEDLKYLELLDKFKDDDLIKDVLHDEVLNKTTLNHRITFYYKNGDSGTADSRKIMEYINTNEYFRELVKINMENARERIEQNNKLLVQIDDLISKYSDKIAKSSTREQGAILLEGEERLDIPGLLRLKTTVIRDTESKKLELLGKNEAIRILSFGESQEVEKEFFSNSLSLVPTILIVIFILIDVFKYFNKKAREFNIE